MEPTQLHGAPVTEGLKIMGRSVTLTADREVGIWGRVGPISGILSVATMVAAWVVMGVALDTGVRSRDPAEVIAEVYADERDERMASTILWVLSMLFLVGFLADVHHRFRSGLAQASAWLATVFLAGGLLLIVAFLTQAWIFIGAARLSDYGQDVQVAKTLAVLGSNGLMVSAVGVIAMTGAAAALSFRFRALPRWLGAFAVLALVVGSIAFWLPIWMLWVLGASIVLLIDPDAATAKPHTTEPEGARTT